VRLGKQSDLQWLLKQRSVRRVIALLAYLYYFVIWLLRRSAQILDIRTVAEEVFDVPVGESDAQAANRTSTVQ
jgi:hypothetical protein